MVGPVVLFVAIVLAILILMSIYSIGPTEVGLVTKRFRPRSCPTTTRSPSTARPATRPIC